MASLAALLEKEAGAELEAILSEAQTRASEIIADAEAEAEALRAQQERSSRSAFDAALVRARSGAQLEASSLRLRKQHEAVESVMAAASHQIAMLTRDGARYEGVLGKLLMEAADGLGGPTKVQEIWVNPADVALTEKLARSMGMTARVNPAESLSGGARLRGSSNVTVENTLEGRLDALRDELASIVSRTLFGERA